MLTLKVITTDSLGNRITHILTGERISHREFETQDRDVDYGCLTLGYLNEEKISDQGFTISFVDLSEGDYIKEVIIFPLAECFIMENGKTVDSFSCTYK